MHDVAPREGLYVLDGHLMHVVRFVAPYVPSGHCVHDDAATLEKLPTGQFKQSGVGHHTTRNQRQTVRKIRIDVRRCVCVTGCVARRDMTRAVLSEGHDNKRRTGEAWGWRVRSC
jgi:hypothetical protein